MAKETFPKYKHPLYSRLWIFKRERSPFWWCGFHHQGKYIRASTKTPHKADAEAWATDWYMEQQIAIRSGKTPQRKGTPPQTVKQASILAVNHYRVLVHGGKKSQQYLNGIILVLNRNVLPYFENMDVSEINSNVWAKYVNVLYAGNPQIALNTVHQIRNALSLCLKEAAKEGWINEAPRLRLESQTNLPTKRVWFEPEEQEKLLTALDDNINNITHKKHKQDAQELMDYVKFVLYSGLRKGEAMGLIFSNIKQKTGKYGIPFIMLEINMGKRGIGLCKPDLASVPVYKSILERRKPESANSPLFTAYHHEMFNRVLNEIGLKFDSLGRKRDFISLRHTYISNKIRQKVPVMEIALNCRTSPAMIQKHYAAHISPELFESLHEKENKDIHKQIAKMAEWEQEIRKSKNIINERMERLSKLLNMSVEDVAKNLPAIERQLNMIEE